jgi:prolyl oligopeptidase
MRCHLLLAIPILLMTITVVSAQQNFNPPASPRGNIVDDLHGVRIPDPYRWLEDQDSPETRAWIERENAYTRSIIDRLPGREGVARRLGELMKIDNIQVPTERHGRYFFEERQAGQDLFVIHVRQGGAGKDEVLIDPHPLSPDHTTSLHIMDVSEDGSVLAYGVRRGGADEVAIHLFDVNRRRDMADVLPSGRYFQVSFKPDKSGFYYSLMEHDVPRIRYHALGSDPGKDEELFGKEYGAEHIAMADVSEDGRYLLIQVIYGSSADRTDIYVQDLARQGPIIPVVKGINARFLGAIGGGHLFLHTNWQAENGRVLAIDLEHPQQEHWREIVPENSDAIEGLALAGHRVVVQYLHDVSSRIRIFSPEGKAEGEIASPVLGSISEVSGRWELNECFYQFSSFAVPPTIFRYDVASRTRSEWARLRVPLNGSDLELKQVWYESRDKTRVPMFLLHRRGLKLDGENPVLMTAYGGFNVSLTPQFSAQAIVWAERGGVFAVPNLRGGGEFGEKWHRAGMMANKQNVFDDFFAAAEWLIANKYANRDRLAASGRSNGGLLMGASITQRPELFRAIVCGYPLLDMLRYEKFLVAPYWVPEYGTAENAEQFKYLYAYSPYQHVAKGKRYPAVLFVSGDGDTRVAPLHARKMAAEMQWATVGSDRPVLLHYDTKSGHSEGRPVNKQIADLTDEISFVMWQLGMSP